MSTAVIIVQHSLPKTSSHIIRAFFHASFVEESFRFIIIYIIIIKSSETFTVVEGVFDSILVGLGFAFAENLHYSIVYENFAILLRCVSSVPLHVFVSGIMGYFLAYRHHCMKEEYEHSGLSWYKKRRFILAVFGFTIPFIIHGIFDLTIFTGGKWNYLIPGILITGFILLEFYIARGKEVISNNVLSILNIDADDMEIIQSQKRNEKWVKEMQDTDEASPSLFINKWTLFNTITSGVLILFALSMLFLFIFKHDLRIFHYNISKSILLSLLVWFPLSIGLIIFFADKINFLFFREQMLRLPLVSLITIKELKSNHLVMDIPAQGVFISGIEQPNIGDEYSIIFRTNDGKKKINVKGIIRWVNQYDDKMPFGALFRYISPGSGFGILRMKYTFKLIKQRLFFRFFPGHAKL